MNYNTIYLIEGNRSNQGMLVYMIDDKSSMKDWRCGVLAAEISSVNKPCDNVYCNESEMTKATEKDFKRFRIQYPQSYNN